MVKINIISAAALSLFALSSCSDGLTVNDYPVPAKIAIELTETEFKQVRANNGFAYELANQVIGEDEGANCLLSPLSATYVLAILENGGANETSRQILDALQYDSEEGMNAVCGKLISGAPKVDTSTEVSIANGVFVDSLAFVKDEYVSSMKSIFGAEVRSLDFSNVPAVVDKVNNWSSDKTKGRIAQIIEKKDVRHETGLLALNAVYFKGIWKKKFDKKKTTKETFTHADGTKEEVDMMQTVNNFNYKSFDNFDMLHMDYGNGGFSMEVMLPRKGVAMQTVIDELKGMSLPG